MCIYRIFSIPAIVLVASLMISAQEGIGSCSEKVQYVNRNQVDTRSITLNGVSGRAIDTDGVAIPNICIGIFTEKGHQFIAQVTTDDEGNFTFKELPSGNYRLVGRVEYDFLCPVNVRIKQKKSGKKKILTLHMQPAGIDDCSYGDVK
jgi:hypothetical protein